MVNNVLTNYFGGSGGRSIDTGNGGRSSAGGDCVLVGTPAGADKPSGKTGSESGLASGRGDRVGGCDDGAEPGAGPSGARSGARTVGARSGTDPLGALGAGAAVGMGWTTGAAEGSARPPGVSSEVNLTSVGIAREPGAAATRAGPGSGPACDRNGSVPEGTAGGTGVGCGPSGPTGPGIGGNSPGGSTFGGGLGTFVSGFGGPTGRLGSIGPSGGM
jgi:hypothetical protein